jgi:phosphoribosyl 1,2-cyclic phosphodiesterase
VPGTGDAGGDVLVRGSMQAVSTTGLRVRVWGARGSIPCPGPDTVRYGGNTSCVEVRCGDHTLIFDGGSGIMPLGKRLLAAGAPIDADILFSHFHLDHVIGLPFFEPCYAPGHRFCLWAGSVAEDHSLQRVFSTLMSPQLFPVGIEEFRAKIEFREFRTGAVLRPRDGIVVRTAALNHPGGATGYRLEFAGRSMAYLTDTEHRPDQLDGNVLALAEDVDLMIYDCTYTDEEYARFKGRGHSTWQHGVRLADVAGAKRLAIFHHDPAHDDAFMDKVAAEADRARAGTLVAREGLDLEL